MGPSCTVCGGSEAFMLGVGLSDLDMVEQSKLVCGGRGVLR